MIVVVIVVDVLCVSVDGGNDSRNFGKDLLFFLLSVLVNGEETQSG